MQTEDNYKRMLMMEEVLKKRMVMVEADGGIHCIPLENIKYLRLYPATEHVDAGVIKGAKFLE